MVIQGGTGSWQPCVLPVDHLMTAQWGLPTIWNRVLLTHGLGLGSHAPVDSGSQCESLPIICSNAPPFGADLE